MIYKLKKLKGTINEFIFFQTKNYEFYTKYSRPDLLYLGNKKNGIMEVWNGKRFSLTLCQEEAGHLALYLCYPSTLAPKLDTLPKLLPTKTLELESFFRNVFRFFSPQICQKYVKY